jgi:hypothetical protein
MHHASPLSGVLMLLVAGSFCFVPDADALILLPIYECGCSLFPVSECKSKFS